MNIIEIQNLTKIYGKGDAAVTAISNINLTVKTGEFVAIMGPSGCGKSTLLHLIGGLDKPSSGKILLDGQDITTMGDDQLTGIRRRKLGFVFQFFNLIPVLTALENTALPMTLDGISPARAAARADEWLKKIGMGDRVSHRPDQLSGGQQQRVAIARALVTDPLLILADEPTGNLDSRASDEVAAELRRVSTEWGRTVLMVTHDPRIAAYADRILFLKDGRIVEDTLLTGSSEDSYVLKEKVEAL